MSDLISRKSVIDEIDERQRTLIYCFGFENDLVKIMDIAKSIVTATPSVQSERKRGRWEQCGYSSFRCSECGEVSCCNTNYCPDCGADMEETSGLD